MLPVVAVELGQVHAQLALQVLLQLSRVLPAALNALVVHSLGVKELLVAVIVLQASIVPEVLRLVLLVGLVTGLLVATAATFACLGRTTPKEEVHALLVMQVNSVTLAQRVVGIV